jgi:ribosome biogenesis GTPase / thiamine phosphate phosphatase
MSINSRLPTLAELGFSSFFSSQLCLPEPWRYVARVAVEHRGRYVLLSQSGPLDAVASGRLRHAVDQTTELPRVGDWVELAQNSPGNLAVIERVLARRTLFARRAAGESHRAQVIAANIDAVLIVSAASSSGSARVQRRGVNLPRLERYFAAVRQSGARALFVLNKIDLARDPETLLAGVREIAGDAPTIATSAASGEGLDALRAAISPDETIALVGSSGVGKSALTNCLLGRRAERIGAVREDDERGRHTTSRRELFLLPAGGALIDTPGMRELALVWAGSDLDDSFDDIARFAGQCRFRDCGHAGEPGCAVIDAIERGELDARRLASRHKLGNELAHELRKLDPEARRQARRAVRKRARDYRARTKLGRGSLD